MQREAASGRFKKQPDAASMPPASEPRPTGARPAPAPVPHRAPARREWTEAQENLALIYRGMGLKPAEMGAIFTEWNTGALDSFLIEITADILKQKDPTNPKKAFVDAVCQNCDRRRTVGLL